MAGQPTIMICKKPLQLLDVIMNLVFVRTLRPQTLSLNRFYQISTHYFQIIPAFSCERRWRKWRDLKNVSLIAFLYPIIWSRWNFSPVSRFIFSHQERRESSAASCSWTRGGKLHNEEKYRKLNLLQQKRRKSFDGACFHSNVAEDVEGMKASYEHVIVELI